MKSRLLCFLLLVALVPLRAAEKTITDFTELTSAASGDELLIYDISATSPKTRKITVANLATAIGSGSGTVTSVGLSTDASWLTVGSSPVTGAGTITLNATSGLTANRVLATPNGATGTVSLRALVAADLPDLSGTYQPLDADLTTYAGITPSANVQALLGAADYAAIRTALGLVIGTNVQAYDADLTTWAGVTPGTGVGTFLATPSSANFATAITDETGTGSVVLASSPTLTSPNIAALNGGTAANDDITIQGTTNATRTTSYLNLQPNGGLIGIGTATPDTKLHLYGIDGATAAAKYERASSDIYGPYHYYLKSRASGTDSATGDLSGGPIFQMRKSSAAQIYAAIWGIIENQTTGAGGIGFHTTTDGSLATATSNEKMRLFSSGGLFVGTSASDPGAGNLVVTGSAKIGNGTAIAKVLSASASINFGSMATGAEDTQTVTVTGAATSGSPSVQLGWSASLEAGIVVAQAWVSAPDTVSIRVRNASGGTIDPASLTVRATVTSF